MTHRRDGSGSRRGAPVTLDRLKRFDQTLRGVVTLTEELALAQAKRAEEELCTGLLYRGAVLVAKLSLG